MSEGTLVPPKTCAACGARLENYFEVTRFAGGLPRGSVQVCSLVCVINWAYSYGAHRVTSTFQDLKAAVSRLASSVRGGRRG